MVNIVITSTSEAVKLEYNGLDREKIFNVTWRNRSTIKMVNLCDVGSANGSYVEVIFDTGSPWIFDIEEDKGVVVDSVDAVTPSDNADLAAKLAAFIKV